MPATDEVQLSQAPPQARLRPSAPDISSWPGRSLAVAGAAHLAVVISKVCGTLHEAGERLGLYTIDRSPHCDPLPVTQMANLPEVTVNRPFIFVPGFQTPEDRFQQVAEKLTAGGKNGGVAYYCSGDHFYLDPQLTQPAHPGPDARVFVAVFDSSQQPPDVSARQLNRSLNAISRQTGSERVDAAAFSMGGLTSRYYLDKGGEKLGKLCMVGTPNQGSELARLSHWLLDVGAQGKDVQWLLDRKPVSEADRAALSWLRPTGLRSKNQQLEELNERWPSQRRRLEDARVVGNGVKRTLVQTARWALGDGVVSAASLALPGLAPMLLEQPEFTGHGLLFSNTEVYQHLTDFLGWQTA